jgi:hypothetical protein
VREIFGQDFRGFRSREIYKIFVKFEWQKFRNFSRVKELPKTGVYKCKAGLRRWSGWQYLLEIERERG